jgi:small subunit ribosomal protein S16
MIGQYQPTNKGEGKQFNVDLARVDYWVGKGAKATDTVASLIKRARKTAVAKA